MQCCTASGAAPSQPSRPLPPSFLACPPPPNHHHHIRTYIHTHTLSPHSWRRRMEDKTKPLHGIVQWHGVDGRLRVCRTRNSLSVCVSVSLPSLSLSLSVSVSASLSVSLPPSVSVSLPPSHSLSLTHTHTHACTHARMHARTHTHTHTHTTHARTNTTKTKNDTFFMSLNLLTAKPFFSSSFLKVPGLPAFCEGTNHFNRS